MEKFEKAIADSLPRDTGRAGNFTSSQIWTLMTNDKSGRGIGSRGLTYIAEKKMEQKLGRCLTQDKSPRSASWGTFVQHRVTKVLLNSRYKPTINVRRAHPTLPWTGAEDYMTFEAPGDVKCYELKNFCQTYEAASFGYKVFKDECPEEFWQGVSNAILTNKKKFELTLYVPYKSELNAIREEADQGDTPYEFQWIKYAKDEQLPYLLDGGNYKNLTTFTFDLDEADALALTRRVEMAVKLLQP